MSVDWQIFRPNPSEVLQDYADNQAAVDRAITEREIDQKAANNPSPWVVLRLRNYGPAYGVLVAYRGAVPAFDVTAWPQGHLEDDSVFPPTIAGPVERGSVIALVIHARGGFQLRITWGESTTSAEVFEEAGIPTAAVLSDAG